MSIQAHAPDGPGIELNDISLLTEFSEQHPRLGYDEAALRWLWYRRKQNRVAEFGAMRKAGGRLIVVRPMFLRWLLESDQ